MTYDLDLARAILRQFAATNEAGQVQGDKSTLSPPPGVPNSDQVLSLIDRLIEVGLVQQTNEIQMRYHPDPVTLRITDIGREWVWRAHDDDEWEASATGLRRILEGHP